jgi:hypothetical protein
MAIWFICWLFNPSSVSSRMDLCRVLYTQASSMIELMHCLPSCMLTNCNCVKIGWFLTAKLPSLCLSIFDKLIDRPLHDTYPYLPSFLPSRGSKASRNECCNEHGMASFRSLQSAKAYSIRLLCCVVCPHDMDSTCAIGDKGDDDDIHHLCDCQQSILMETWDGWRHYVRIWPTRVIAMRRLDISDGMFGPIFK